MLLPLMLFAASIALLGTALPVQADGTYMESSSSSPIVGRLVDPVLLRGIEDVHMDGDFAYLPCREGKRLTVCAIADPLHPKIVSSFVHPDLDDAAGLAVAGDVLYLTSQNNHRLLVIDAGDKRSLKLLGSVVLGPSGKGVLYKVAYRDGFCYVPHLTEKKLFVVDVRDSRHPSVAGSVAVTPDDDGAYSVRLLDNCALVGTIFGRQNRLAVVEIGDPAHPRLLTQLADDPAIGQISGDLAGSLFFAVNWDANALLVFDMAHPAQPKLIGKLVDERLGKPNRCVVSGDRAYLPMVQGDGVAVVDIANPRRPKFLARFVDPILKKAYGAALRGELLFIGAREGNSLTILDRRLLDSACNN